MSTINMYAHHSTGTIGNPDSTFGTTVSVIFGG